MPKSAEMVKQPSFWMNWQSASPAARTRNIPSDASVEEEVHLHQLTDVITRFLSERTETERVLFVRRYFFNEPLKEIASRTGITRGNIKTILYRMRQDLRNVLKQEDYIQ